MRKALLGILPGCGHACAVDSDTSMEARMQMAEDGCDILTLPIDVATARMRREWDEHMKTCKKAGQG